MRASISISKQWALAPAFSRPFPRGECAHCSLYSIMDYSTLFKFGLLSDAASSPYSNVPAPWASDADSYKPRRRESLPSTIDEISLIAPISATMTQDTTGSITSGGSSSLYFTVRKKRSSKEHRSFLSLDLAESQSLRSASLRKKESPRALRSATRTGIANAYIPAPTSS